MVSHLAIEQHQAASFANNTIKSRTHIVDEVFPFGVNSSQVMLRGTIDTILANGEMTVLLWTGRASYIWEDGGVKMKFVGWNR